MYVRGILDFVEMRKELFYNYAKNLLANNLQTI